MTLTIKKFNRIISKLEKLLVIKKEYGNKDYFELVNYFKIKMIENGFTVSKYQYQKSITYAKDVLSSENFNHIKLKDWKDCIDWVFSDYRRRHEFWGKVTISTFGTVVKAYNDFIVWKLNNKKSKKIGYGKK